MNLRTSLVALLIFGALALLAGPSVRAGIWDHDTAACHAKDGSWTEDCWPNAGALDNISQDNSTQWMDIHTDSPEAINVQYRMSRTPSDFNCEKAQGNDLTLLDKFSVAADRPKKLAFAFSRQQKPGIALYEWHVCFLVEGTVYRAWRGYDPGPGATLNVHCTINIDQLKSRDTDSYLCPDVDVAFNADNYSKYAMHCDANGCTPFQHAADYKEWRQFNPLPETDQDQIAEAIIRYSADHKTFLGLNAKDFAPYLTVRGRDPSPELIKAVENTRFRFAAGSQYQARTGGMHLSIGTFTATASDIAYGGVFGYCGLTCAASERFDLKKLAGRWVVDSYRLLWIS